MNIKIQSPHFTINDGLNDYAIEKVERLSHLYDRIESADVRLELNKSKTTDNKVCEIRLAVPGNNLFAKSKSDNFNIAINEAVNALQRQIEKIKTE